MTDRPTLLLEHHLKELRLPSFLREYVVVGHPDPVLLGHVQRTVEVERVVVSVIDPGYQLRNRATTEKSPVDGNERARLRLQDTVVPPAHGTQMIAIPAIRL